MPVFYAFSNNFYPRSPCGERLHAPNRHPCCCNISIHALLAESDGRNSHNIERRHNISIHALLAESDSIAGRITSNGTKFLSTLSLRRATMPIIGTFRSTHNFYPRSPCGERPFWLCEGVLLLRISIHALLAESDGGGLLSCFGRIIFLSTLSLRRATVHGPVRMVGNRYFYPRSPCGERRQGDMFQCPGTEISIHALLAESDNEASTTANKALKFLSTLSLRRATLEVIYTDGPTMISIHALLAESDPHAKLTGTLDYSFLSTLSLRRATSVAGRRYCQCHSFLSTLSLRRATVWVLQF